MSYQKFTNELCQLRSYWAEVNKILHVIETSFIVLKDVYITSRAKKRSRSISALKMLSLDEKIVKINLLDPGIVLRAIIKQRQ